MLKKLSLITLIFIFYSSVSSADSLSLERRVILDESFNWLRPEKADKLLNEIKSTGFNVFMPVVWHGRGATWETELVQKEPLWANGAKHIKDPLKTLIDKAHSKGIEVHPWFTVVLRQRDIFQEFYDEGSPQKAFNIHDEAYRDFIVNLMLEVVKNYDIDGVNLDYIRSMGNCMSAECVTDYYQKTGRDLAKDVAVQWRDSVAAFHIGLWNEKPVTDIVKRFSLQARKLRPELLISVDTHPIHKRLVLEGANAINWANEGYIDMIYDMQYKSEINFNSFNKAKSRLKEPSKIALMVGNFERSMLNKEKVYPRDHKLLIKHVNAAIKESNSIAVYEYRYLSKEQRAALVSGPFKEYIK